MTGWLPVLAVVLLFGPGSARADIDESAYDAGGVITDARERERIQARIAAEVEAERRREAERAESEGRAREAAAAREAARPYPERLTTQRCTACHPDTRYTAEAHTPLGWRLVVERMVRLNGAQIPRGERPVIAAYLAEAHPAGTRERVIEYGLPPIGLAAVAGLALAARRRYARRPHFKE